MLRLAQRRVLRTISRAGTAPSAATAWRAGRRGAATASVPPSPLAASGAAAGAAAHDLKNKLKKNGTAHVAHFDIMLKACADSTEMRHVIGTEMPAARVEPNAGTFRQLVRRLMVEGDAAGARRVVEEEMQLYDRTLETLNTPEVKLGKMRTFELQRDVAAAYDLMDRLKNNGTADVWHYRTMLRACEDSTEMRHVIGTEMPAARVEPNVGTFNQLVSRLMVEGDAAGARRVVEEEMPAAGVQPDDLILETLNRSEHELSKMRAGKLQRLIKAGDVAAAHELMDKLKDNGTADVWHFTIMLRACEDSTEMRHVIGTEMPAARVEPNVVTFTTLVSRLMFEGDAAGARRVVEEEMPAAGVQPDDRTLDILHKPEHELGKMRAGELQRLIKAGDVAAAHVLMDKLKDNGTADVGTSASCCERARTAPRCGTSSARRCRRQGWSRTSSRSPRWSVD